MQENWPAAIAAVWKYDGVKDDEAPGETFVTTYGITAMTWRDAVHAGIVNKPQRDCTPDDAKLILKTMYWDKTCCDEWPAGIDLMVFDFAMLAGNRAAIECLQQAVHQDDDGIIGIHTMTAVAGANVGETIRDLKQCHLDYLSTLHNWRTFHEGWTNRQNFMTRLALDMEWQARQAS